MKTRMYEVIFKATETLQNGNEREVHKSVYMPRFDENNKHITEARRIERGAAALASAHYYKIRYVKTVTTDMIFA